MILVNHELVKTLLPKTLDEHVTPSHGEVRILIQLVLMVEAWRVCTVQPIADTVLLNEVEVTANAWVSGDTWREDVLASMVYAVGE